ncbi:MAG: glycosyltransferase family 39 protein [Anaerolineae bacterium]|jgi:hypothetical protein
MTAKRPQLAKEQLLDGVSGLETAWAAFVAALAAFGLLAVALAQLGLFRPWAVGVAVAVACAAGWGAWRLLKPLARPAPRRETLFLAILIVAGGLLYGWPAEELLQNGDASIYPNTATMLLRTGGLSYHYAPLDGLTEEEKELFYIPAEQQLSDIEIQSYEGLLYGAYYVMDPGQNTIVSSRPPLTIVWMGLFGMLGGELGMLYVTPVFGTLSLVIVYFLGKRLFSDSAGAVAAVWQLVSFPQLYFSRTSYAEVVGQLFVLSLLYALVTYWQTRRHAYLLLALAALTAAFAARIDFILVVPTLHLFLVLLALRRDWKATALVLLGAAVTAAFTVWTMNQPYTGATAEIVLGGHLRSLLELPIGVQLGASSAALAVVALIGWLASRMSELWRGHLFRWGLAVLVVVGVSFALWIRPLFPTYVRLADGSLWATHSEEILAITARYLSPLFVWLAAAGVILIPWRKRLRFEQILLLVFVISFAGPFFWKYTTARVYPVALRRLLPEVLPAMYLFGASLISWLGRRRTTRWLALGAVGLTAALLLGVSGPYWFHQGSTGALNLLHTLAERIPDDSVVLIEPRQEGSIVGWFASPLWSSGGDNALLLNDTDIDGELFDTLLCQWQYEGTEVYLLAQDDPETWWPGDFTGQVEETFSWESSIIGQSLRFPPFIWRFDFQFQLYHLDNSACPAS